MCSLCAGYLEYLLNGHGIFTKSNNVTKQVTANTNTFIFLNPDYLILNIISK